MSAQPARTQTSLQIPDDMRLPDGMTLAPLDQQLAAIRSDVHRWISINEPRSRREYGEGAMHPQRYRAGLQARLSVYHTLFQLTQSTP